MVQKRRNRNLRLSEFGINDVLPAARVWEALTEKERQKPGIRICYSVRKKMIEWRSAQSGYSIGFVGDRAVCQILSQPFHAPVIWKTCDPPGNLIGSAASFVDAKLWCEKRFGHGN
jgi:hypothetical protein